MEKIKKLRGLFNNYNIDGYLVAKNDEFFGEYVPNDNDRLKFISNFSGSYGYALILRDKNYLFVDGRYTLQARIQSGKFFNIVTIPNKNMSVGKQCCTTQYAHIRLITNTFWLLRHRHSDSVYRYTQILTQKPVYHGSYRADINVKWTHIATEFYC